jgi:predicted permease
MPLWQALRKRRQRERELDEEILFDLAEETRLRIERGEPPDSARTTARREFGSITGVKEETREAWGWRAPERLAQDLGFAVRTVRKTPGFALASASILAVGIGLCSFLFSTLDALLLRPMEGAREPSQLVASQGLVPFPYFESYRDLKEVAASAAAYIGSVPFNVALEGGGTARPERVVGHLVSLEYFATLGADPFLGRFFEAELERRGAAPTAVVSERFWRTRLNADPHAVGRVLWINGRSTTIVGVAAKGFHGLFPINPADIFVPVTADAAVAPELAGNILDNPAARAFRIVLRLPPNATLASAEAAIDARTRQLDDHHGNLESDRDRTPQRVRLTAAGSATQYPGELRTLVIVFMGTLTALILTFTCANLAGLVVARGHARSREVALRLALGASRFRLVRQLMAECVLVAVAGGAGGLALTYLFIELLTRTVSSSPLFRLAVQLTPSPRVAALTFFTAVVVGIGLGLLPALAVTRTDLVGGLKAHASTRLAPYRRVGLRNLFVVYQITAATALVVIMGFFIAGIQQGGGRDVGFETAGLFMFSVDPVRDNYSPDRAAELITTLLEQLTGHATIAAAALMDPGVFPLFVLPDTTVSVPAVDPGVEHSIHRVAVQRVGPGFFATLDVPLQRGREFSETDLRGDATPGVAIPAIVNHTAADLFGDVDPLGRFIRLDDRVLRVTGVVRYGLAPPFRATPAPIVFLPLRMEDLRRSRPQGVAVLVRAGDETGLEPVRSALRAIDSRLTMFNARAVRDQLDDLYNIVRYNTAIYAIVGLFGLVLASIGLAGVTAHAAVRRRKEIGIRMALGARRRQVLSLVAREGATMAAVGMVLGVLTALAFARGLMAFDPQLAQSIVLTGNPASLLAGPAVLLAVTAIACYIPARRSATVDPVVTLREE